MNKQKNAIPGAVLVTGSSSGIGFHTSIKLAKEGFTVFATVRKETDASYLKNLNIQGLVPVWPVDLTVINDITRLAETIKKELDQRNISGLSAIVNNAGGGSPAPLELMDLAKFHTELRTRILGPVALLQAFLPMIRKANGRVLWIMTPAIIPTPYVASIHACDFAANCIVRTLNIELKTWKIPNIMIRCGGIKTPAGMRTAADVDAILQNKGERVKLYKESLLKWKADMLKFDEKRTDPEKVAEVVLKALVTYRPRRQYLIGYMSKAAAFLEFLPQSLTDRILKMRF